MEQLFNTKFFSRFSNQENGIRVQDENVDNNFIINKSNYFFGIFDMEEDKVLSDGKVGRVVVTYLFIKVMPLIRYDTDDIDAKTLIESNERIKYAINQFGERFGDIITDV